MATLKANGGAYRILERRGTAQGGTPVVVKLAVCANGKVLRNSGLGWKLYADARPETPAAIVAKFEAIGWRVDSSAPAIATLTRSQADAHAHIHSLQLRRLRR